MVLTARISPRSNNSERKGPSMTFTVRDPVETVRRDHFHIVPANHRYNDDGQNQA